MKTKLFSRICGWIMAAVLAGGLFTSCGLTKLADDIVNGDGFENYGWTEQGNKLKSKQTPVRTVVLLS